MIRKTLILLWMLFPVGVAAYHFNYGPKQEARERAYRLLCEIRQLEQEKEPDWQEIIDQYNALLDELPLDEDPQVICQIRLAVCKARLEMLDLDKAIGELTRLLQETAAAYGENARITRGVREQLGKAYYYATWTLKTNNAPEDQWRPFAERARQLFRYLAELEDPQEFGRYEDRVREEFQKVLERADGTGHNPLDEDTMMTRRSMLAAAILAAICLGTAVGLIAAGGGGDRATSQDVSIQSIRGIKGIDTVTLQNLEAVLRIQTREPPPPKGHPHPVFAPTTDTTQTDDPQPDVREEMTVNLEGS